MMPAVPYFIKVQRFYEAKDGGYIVYFECGHIQYEAITPPVIGSCMQCRECKRRWTLKYQA